MAIEQSILNSTKKSLGYTAEYTAFDHELLMHINGVLADLGQIGIGPPEGFTVEDDQATWEQFMGLDNRLNSVKTYVTLRVKMLFDPPQTAFTTNSMKEQLREWEWRLREYKDGETWMETLT